MSKLGKAALVIAILASIGSLVFGYLVANDKKRYVDQLTNADAALKHAPPPITYTSNFRLSFEEPAKTIGKYNTEIKTVQDNLTSTKDQLAAKEAALTKTQVELTRVTESEASAKAEVTKLKTDLEAATTASAAATDELSKLKTALQGQDPAQLIADLAKNKEDLKIAQDQNKTSEFENKALAAEIERLRDLEERRDKHNAPQDLTAKVVAINKPWNFVVLDAGTDKKLVEGVELMVYRGNQLVGKVRTVNVDNKTAVADVLSDWTKLPIQIGDQVLF